MCILIEERWTCGHRKITFLSCDFARDNNILALFVCPKQDAEQDTSLEHNRMCEFCSLPQGEMDWPILAPTKNVKSNEKIGRATTAPANSPQELA
ncbi:hypothetical protein AAP_06124 [Ascosphaera apis ARSEF 7405]|uniref:Uncharacterized protein n=1 Tax=Ascosphaera apis ARSEF 7405 TaxID=392613 RepID=A0A166MZD9_9EURO|nr:hypothetical protein AAP_06124 [Ascosphaera apis ARSEF 7405]